MFKILASLLGILVLCFGTQQPDFIITCRQNDPNFNACALKNANIAVPRLVKGYRPYNLPKMTPLHIPRIEIQAGSNLNIELTNNKVYGLENTIVNDIDMQISKKHFIFKVHIPIASIVGQYKMNGRILILPIRGEGPANVTITNGDYVYSMDYTLIEKDGKEYMNITDHKITFTTTRAYYYFENLFNGDSNLAKQMNAFLDENWKEVTKDMGSTVAETISSIITSIVQNIFFQVPFDQLIEG